MMKFQKAGHPLTTTHYVVNDEHDAILQGFSQNNLKNTASDPVKVIFYPTYLSGADGLIDLSYYEAIVGCHLGVFPSLYEPWGYTPLEAGALGVACVTTDLAGFGRYFCTECSPEKTPGI